MNITGSLLLDIILWVVIAIVASAVLALADYGIRALWAVATSWWRR